MATSTYFNNYNARYSEQRLYEDLIVESIKIMGFDAYYLPNDNDEARDLLFGEDPLKKFNSAFPLEMYLSSALEYQGEKEFFSKFGLEIRNNVSVVLSKRSFSQRVPQNTFNRPREGDLIWIPFLYGTGELYEIKFTDATKDFFTLGRKNPYFYEMQLEKFKFSNEIIETGVSEIDDQIRDEYPRTRISLIAGGSGSFVKDEIVYQGANLSVATAQALVHDYNTGIHLDIYRTIGTFSANTVIKGNTSSAVWNVSTSSDTTTMDNAFEDIVDNNRVETEADAILDWTERNPFGEA